MTERISNNSWIVSLEERYPRRTYQVRWKEGSSASTPTEQEIRDCFTPLYNTGSAAGSTTATGSSSTDETEDTGGDGGGDEDEDEGEGSTNGGTSEDEDESED
jgi:hypothetical protein